MSLACNPAGAAHDRVCDASSHSSPTSLLCFAVRTNPCSSSDYACFCMLCTCNKPADATITCIGLYTSHAVTQSPTHSTTCTTCRLKEKRRCVIVLLCGTSGSGKSTLASVLVSDSCLLASWHEWHPLRCIMPMPVQPPCVTLPAVQQHPLSFCMIIVWERRRQVTEMAVAARGATLARLTIQWQQQQQQQLHNMAATSSSLQCMATSQMHRQPAPYRQPAPHRHHSCSMLRHELLCSATPPPAAWMLPCHS